MEQRQAASRRRASGIAAIVLVAVASLFLVPEAASAQGYSAPDTAAEAAFVARINDLRASKGLGPLQVDAELTEIGRRWARTMAEAGDIWHNPDFASWVKNPSWTVLGENVGLGPDVPTLHQAFVDSPSHYKNLVDARFSRIGVGVVYGDDGVMYTSHQFMALAGSEAASANPPPSPGSAASAPSAVSPPPATKSRTPVPAAPHSTEPEQSASTADSARATFVPAMLSSLRSLDALSTAGTVST